MDMDFEFVFISPLWCTIAKEKHLLPCHTYVFQRILVHPSVTWVHFTERSEGGTGLPATSGSRFGWRFSGLPTRKMVQSVLSAFFLWRTIRQNFFIQKYLFYHCLLWILAFPAAFPFPQAISSSALHLELQLLCFLFAGNRQRRKWEENILLAWTRESIWEHTEGGNRSWRLCLKKGKKLSQVGIAPAESLWWFQITTF